MMDVSYREQFTDAVATILCDQERSGLDILTNGDLHLDASLGGHSWELFPTERVGGIMSPGLARLNLDDIGPAEHPPGTLLRELFTAERYPDIIGKITPGPIEYDKLWRLAQARTSKPVKFGTVSAQMAAASLTVSDTPYSDNQRQLMWDMAEIVNGELRRLAAAGCATIQIEEPLIHYAVRAGRDDEWVRFLIDVFNREVAGLDDVEVWIHSCWGNPNMQRVVDPIPYAALSDIFLDELDGDVWTLELSDDVAAGMAGFAPRKRPLPKKLAIGVVSHRNLQVETPAQIAAKVRDALKHVDAENVVLTSDCGFGRQGANRQIAFYKCVATAQAANLVRRELGAEEQHVRAADPRLQPDG
jgi:5-methyltetrahydropteroyltriglutamate--homocysteine methyltransferase